MLAQEGCVERGKGKKVTSEKESIKSPPEKRTIYISSNIQGTNPHTIPALTKLIFKLYVVWLL